MKKLILPMLLGIVLSSINGQDFYTDTARAGSRLYMYDPYNQAQKDFQIEHETISLGQPEQQTTLIFKNWPSALRVFLRLKRAGIPRPLEAIKVGSHKYEYHIKNLKQGDFQENMPRSRKLVIPINIQLRINK